MRTQSLHFRAFAVTVVWTLALLLLGSVVHATESSLACPDWPTCYGTLMPEMEGGVFWEHLHRLVAGGLILMFGLATWLVRREVPESRGLFRAALFGLGLLLVQAVFGGLTVILKLPDWISTTHLTLALVFLSLATVLAAITSPARAGRAALDPGTRRSLLSWGAGASILVLLQSLLGGAVRHMDAGMACPDMPTCLGSWVPPLTHPLVTVHFAHRALGVLTLLAVLGMAVRLLGQTRAPHVRRAALAAAALVVLQVALGFISVATTLAVTPVSLHTLVAATLLTITLLLTTWGRLEEPRPAGATGVDPAERVSRAPSATAG